MSSGRGQTEEERRWLDSEVWTARSPDRPELETSAAARGGVEAEDGPAPPREEEGNGAADADAGKGAGGGDPSLKDVYELLRRCSARLEGAGKEDEDRLAGELKKLSGIAGKLTELGEESRTLPAKMTGGGAGDGAAWKAAAERFEEAIRAHSEDFGGWVKGERSFRRRLPALALAVAAPAFLVLGVLVQMQFELIPPHDPSNGWQGWIWQHHGRAISDCAVQARQAGKPVTCSFEVGEP